MRSINGRLVLWNLHGRPHIKRGKSNETLARRSKKTIPTCYDIFEKAYFVGSAT